MDAYNKVLPEWFDWYKTPKDIDKWLECDKCKHKPKIWVFDYGRYAQCACAKTYRKYDKINISAESIMSHIRRTGGDTVHYDSDGLRKAWNEHVEKNLFN